MTTNDIRPVIKDEGIKARIREYAGEETGGNVTLAVEFLVHDGLNAKKLRRFKEYTAHEGDTK